MQLRRDKLTNYTRLEENFAGQICRPYQDGLRNCVENQPKWPLVQKEDPCMDLLKLAQSRKVKLDPIPLLTVNVSNSSLVSETTKSDHSDCDTIGYLFLNVLSSDGFGCGFLIGFWAYIFYVCVAYPFMMLIRWLQRYIRLGGKNRNSLQYTSVKEGLHDPCMSLTTTTGLDSTLV